MPTIVATAGASNANSFASEAQFIARAADRLHVPAGTTREEGETECTDNEKRALIQATEVFSTLRYIGWRATETQALPWPRLRAPRFDAANVIDEEEEPEYYDEDEIPDLLVNATIDFALEMLADSTVDILAGDDEQGVIRKKVDVLETEWASGYAKPQGLARYPRILRNLAPLIDRSGGLELARC